MLRAMSRNLLGGLFLSFAPALALAPFVTACDALKSGAADAAPVAVTPLATPATPPATAEPPPAAVQPVAPLGQVTPPPGAGHPGAPGTKPAAADGGTAIADGGKAAPAAPGVPTPTFVIPTAIPGFDAGAFKPPAGFPSTIPTTLPTFPPPSK